MASTNKVSVLLLNPPFRETIIRDNYCCFTSKSGYIWPPVDLLYLSGILNNENIETTVIDAVVDNLTWEQVEEKIYEDKPKIIISLTGTASFREDMTGLRRIKEIYSPSIYILGNAPAFKPKLFLQQYPFIDRIIHNFLDSRILPFVLEHIKECETISFKKDNKIKIGKVNYLKPLSKIKNVKPPQYNLFPIKKYTTPIAQKTPLVTTLTSFGCPFHCHFCVGSALNYHQRNIKELEREFNEMEKNGIKEIFFEDSTFNANNDYLHQICSLLINNNYNFSWSANIHSFNVSETNLKLMKKAGCHTVQIGVESGDENILKECAPSKKINKLKEVFNLCHKVGIRTLGYFIIGFPKETPKLALKTINLAKELDPTFVSFSVLTPDYGTKLYDQAVKDSLIDYKSILSFDSSGEAVLKNQNFSKEEQDRMIKLAYKQFYFRPQKLLSYIKDYRNLILYLKNGLRLFAKKIFI
jgi:radical SAM superfamily enzyme YgiQ (UPF0313 family)